MNNQEIAAKVLVKCGYADAWRMSTYCSIESDVPKPTIYTNHCSTEGSAIVDPFTDTLDGRRQLDALFDYFSDKNMVIDALMVNNHMEGLGRNDADKKIVKWCLEQLQESDL